MSEGDNLSAWRWATAASQTGFESAYVAFRTALQAAWPSANAEQAVAEAYGRYLGSLQQLWETPDLGRRAADSYADFAKLFQQAFVDESARNKVRVAFEHYLEDLKRAFAALDPKTVTPYDLSAIAQSVVWVSAVAVELSRKQDAPLP